MRVVIVVVIFLSSGSLYAQNAEVNLKLIKSTVERWSEAHNTRSSGTFVELYAPSLLFYTKYLPYEECIRIKFNQMNAKKSYNQKIISSLENTFYKSGIIRCDFIKEVRINSKVIQSRSYLLMMRLGNTYQIVGESDLSTDEKYNYQQDLGPQYKINELKVVDVFTKLQDNQKDYPVAGWVVLTSVFVIGTFIFYQRHNDSKERTAANTIKVIMQPVVQKEHSKKHVEKVEYEEGRKLQEILNSELFARKHGRRIPMKKTDNSRESLKRKGDEFEAYIFERFDRKYFKIRYWNGDLSYKGFYPEANTYPDLEIEFKCEEFKRVFAVECKFRSSLNTNSFQLETRNLDNYRRYGRERSIRVYIALGLYGEPSNPKKMYLIPLEIFNGRNYLTYKELANYERSANYFYYDRKSDKLS